MSLLRHTGEVDHWLWSSRDVFVLKCREKYNQRSLCIEWVKPEPGKNLGKPGRKFRQSQEAGRAFPLRIGSSFPRDFQSRARVCSIRDTISLLGYNAKWPTGMYRPVSLALSPGFIFLFPSTVRARRFLLSRVRMDPRASSLTRARLGHVTVYAFPNAFYCVRATRSERDT